VIIDAIAIAIKHHDALGFLQLPLSCRRNKLLLFHNKLLLFVFASGRRQSWRAAQLAQRQ
jgi:hypothetical protein